MAREDPKIRVLSGFIGRRFIHQDSALDLNLNLPVIFLFYSSMRQEISWPAAGQAYLMVAAGIYVHANRLTPALTGIIFYAPLTFFLYRDILK